MENPYSPPQASLEPAVVGADVPRVYGGMGRPAYFGIMLGLFFGPIPAIAVVETFDPLVLPDFLSPLIPLGFWILSIIPAYYRLKNIGMNPWWSLLMVVPIANVFVGVRCLMMPRGYADTRKLDLASKVIACIVLGLLVLLVALVGVELSRTFFRYI